MSWIFGFDALDFELYPKSTLFGVLVIRFGLGMLYGEKDFHPDQNWQGQELAYKLVYGDGDNAADNIVTWEWLDAYALRTILYPAYLSIPLHILKFIGMDSNILVVNSQLFMNSLI